LTFGERVFWRIDSAFSLFSFHRSQIKTLVERELANTYATRAAEVGATLVVDPAVVLWLVGRLDYDGGNLPLEGASQVRRRTAFSTDMSVEVEASYATISHQRHVPAYVATTQNASLTPVLLWLSPIFAPW
jgi:hypothetical protein